MADHTFKVGDRVRRDCKGCRYEYVWCRMPRMFCIGSLTALDCDEVAFCSVKGWRYCPVSQLTLVRKEPTIVGNELRMP